MKHQMFSTTNPREQRRELAGEWQQLREAIRFLPGGAYHAKAVLRTALRLKEKAWASTHPRFAAKHETAGV